MAYPQQDYQRSAPRQQYYNQGPAPIPRQGPPQARGPPPQQQQRYYGQGGQPVQPHDQYNGGYDDGYNGYDSNDFWDDYSGSNDPGQQGYDNGYGQQRQNTYPPPRQGGGMNGQGQGYDGGYGRKPQRPYQPKQNYSDPQQVSRQDSPARYLEQQRANTTGGYPQQERQRGPGGPEQKKKPKRPPLVHPNEPKQLSFDNPFPVFPGTKKDQEKKDRSPVDEKMSKMDLNGRPSLDKHRSPVERRNDRPFDQPQYHANGDGPGSRAPRNDGYGPPARSATMPNDQGYGRSRDDEWIDHHRPGPNYGPGPGRSATAFQPDRRGAPRNKRHSSFDGGRSGQYQDWNQPAQYGFDGYGPSQQQQMNQASLRDADIDRYMPDFNQKSPIASPPPGGSAIPIDPDSEAAARAAATSPLGRSGSRQAQAMPGTNAAMYTQARAARSQPDLGASGRSFEMARDAPPMPGMAPQQGGWGGPNGQQDPYGYVGGRGQRTHNAGGRGMPPMERGMTSQTMHSVRTDPGPAPPLPMGQASFSSRTPAPRQAPQDQSSNPDALPAHPTPFRPGLMQDNSAPPPQQQMRGQAPPVRQYHGSMSSVSGFAPPSTAGRASMDSSSRPVTYDEINQLRTQIRNNPQDHKTHLLLAKRLVEASQTLANENQPDPKARQKAREKFVFEAHKHVKRLVSQNYPEAMFYLADCYGQGMLGLEADTKEAFALYQSAAKLGHSASAYRTAVCCEMGADEGGGTRRDPLKAVQWYRRAAALGSVPAMYKLGMILLKGLLGQAVNVTEAVNWLKRAAERADAENPHALHELAMLYETAPFGGNKLIKDERYAFSLYAQAAQLGYKFSQARLGKVYEFGQLGQGIDNRLSIHHYARAAAQEEHESELALSGWYLTGCRGVLEQSDTEAYLWARKAALAELPKAMYAMGYFSEVGIGMGKPGGDLNEARVWYGRAASHRYGKAQERLEELKRGGAKAQKGRERLSRTDRKQHEDCVVM